MRVALLLIISLLVISVPIEADNVLTIAVLRGDRQSEDVARFLQETLRLLDIESKLTYFSQESLDKKFYNPYFSSFIDFDLAVYQLQYERSRFPDISIQYNPDDGWGEFLYDLDESLFEYEEMSMQEYLNALDSYSVEYMQHPSIDISLFFEYEEISMQPGIPQWDPQMDVMHNLRLGLTWNNPDRNYSSTHFNLPEPESCIEYFMDPLLFFDEELHPQAALAYQWIENPGEYVFLIRDDAYWSNTTNYDGEDISRKLDANDFALSIEASMNGYSLPWNEFVPVIDDYEVRSTIHPNDTLVVYMQPNPGNLFYLGNMYPLHYNLFGGTLHETALDNYFTYDLYHRSYNGIEDSREWRYFLNHTSFVGPFKGNRTIVMRGDYYFPRNSDVVSYYNHEAFSDLEHEYRKSLNLYEPNRYWMNTLNYSIDFLPSNTIAYEMGNLDFIEGDHSGRVMRKMLDLPALSILVDSNIPNLAEVLSLSIDREELGRMYDNVVIADHILFGSDKLEGHIPEYSIEKAREILYSKSETNSTPIMLFIWTAVIIKKSASKMHFISEILE
ncbi:MAG: hypothetical protein INQ03_09115 [Candidatus Heimdallarchaeota archaeon]|nr:hypothetical protein [Candidatus Heimdallarchaeota archaeon]